MSALLIIGLIIVVVLGGLLWVTSGFIGLLLTVLMAGLIGWAADMVVPGRLPGGWLGAVVAGIIGGFLGQLVLGNLGPALFGVRIIPAFAGAVVVAAAAELLTKSRSRARLS
jgi:uncharacterized membrane protein YeaQ/YmgE (transglycosylase-associated protein family)